MILEQLLLGMLFLAGFGGLIFCKNLIKKVFALSIMNSAVILLFMVEGDRIGKRAPLVLDSQEILLLQEMVDPLPQALMLTAVVVGLCVTAFALVLVYRLHREYGTLNIDIIYERIRDASH